MRIWSAWQTLDQQDLEFGVFVADLSRLGVFGRRVPFLHLVDALPLIDDMRLDGVEPSIAVGTPEAMGMPP
jgi:hypothetical protein